MKSMTTDQHQNSSASNIKDDQLAAKRQAAQLLIEPIIEKMRPIEGWLADAEARLLIGATRHAVKTLPNVHAIVEIGSYCGKSTVVIAGALALGNVSKETKVFAIDPHAGEVGASDSGVYHMSRTLEVFNRNITAAGIAELVEPVIQYSFDVEWDKPISLLFIDGLHDYENVSRDFNHFEAWVADGGLVAFHDYAPYFPGVKTFVDEVMSGGRYTKLENTLSLIVLRKTSSGG